MKKSFYDILCYEIWVIFENRKKVIFFNMKDISVENLFYKFILSFAVKYIQKSFSNTLHWNYTLKWLSVVSINGLSKYVKLVLSRALDLLVCRRLEIDTSEQLEDFSENIRNGNSQQTTHRRCLWDFGL